MSHTRTPSRRTLVLLVTPIVVVSIVGAIGNALAPTLLKNHPLWLVALEPRNRYLVLVSTKVDLVPFLVIGTLRRVSSDPLFFLLGYFYGESAVRWMERKAGSGGRLVRATERLFARAAPVMVLAFPGALVCTLAGATGMSLTLFLVLNVVGTIVTLLLVYQFGDLFSGPVDAIVDFVDENYIWLTVVTVLVTAWFLWDQRRRGGSDIPSVSELERELGAVDGLEDQQQDAGADKGDEHGPQSEIGEAPLAGGVEDGTTQQPTGDPDQGGEQAASPARADRALGQRPGDEADDDPGDRAHRSARRHPP